MKSSINLLEQLDKEREQQNPASLLLEEVRTMLQAESERETDILSRIEQGFDGSLVSGELLDKGRIYTYEQIRRVAVRYRLRFLDTSLYQGEIPAEAVHKARQFEISNGIDAAKYRILAPGKKFRLTDGDTDPLLFAELKNGNYYLIHQWGRDLSLWRRMMAYPFTSFPALMLVIAAFSVLLTLLIPTDFLTTDTTATYWNSYRFTFLPWIFLIVSGVTAFLWFTFHRSLSEDQWESSTFN